MLKADTAAVLTVARAQIGTVEQPARSGRQKYGAWYGMNGAPWCAIFVSWVFWHAGTPLPPIRTKKGFAYVPDVQAWAQANGCWRTRSYRPSPGDLIVYSFGGSRADHVGIVELVLPDGRYQTIEGNTSGSNPRMGGMVDRMRRRSNVLGFVEVTDIKSGVKAPVEDDMPLTEAEIDRIAERVWSRRIVRRDVNMDAPASMVVGDIFYNARQGAAWAKAANTTASLTYMAAVYVRNAADSIAKKVGAKLREDGTS